MYCEACGVKISDDARFCPNCGHKFVDPNLVDDPVRDNSQQIPNIQPKRFEQPQYVQPEQYQQPVQYAQPGQYYQPVQQDQYYQPAQQNGYNAGYQNQAYQGQGYYYDDQGRPYSRQSVHVHREFKVLPTLIAVAIIAIVVFLGWSRFMAPSPEAVVAEFMDDLTAMDLKGAVECVDPRTQAQFKGVLSLADTLIGAAAGIGVDTESLLGLAPLFMDEELQGYMDIKILQMDTEYNTDGFVHNLAESIPFLKHVEKVFAKEATVKVLFEYDGETETQDFPMKKYSGKWKIEAYGLF